MASDDHNRSREQTIETYERVGQIEFGHTSCVVIFEASYELQG